MTEPVNPYRPGVCWYGVKTRQVKGLMPCGIAAKLYRAQRQDVVTGGTTAFPSDLTVWLCPNHADRLKNDGFSLTLVLQGVR